MHHSINRTFFQVVIKVICTFNDVFCFIICTFYRFMIYILYLRHKYVYEHKSYRLEKVKQSAVIVSIPPFR